MRRTTVLDVLEETARRLPDKVYLRDEAGTLTYGQCTAQARRAGAALSRSLGGRRRQPVVIFIDKSRECVVAMLAVLYSGNFYVPMDVKTPQERFSSILATLENAAIVSAEAARKALEKLTFQAETFYLETLLADESSSEDARSTDEILAGIRRSIVDADLMYVLYTSGSTGVPKGVCVRHRSVIDYLESYAAAMPLAESDIVGNQTPLYVDMSLKDVYSTMNAGATVCLIPQKYFMTPKKLLTYLDAEAVTLLMWVPTAYRLISQFDALSLVRPSSLATLVFTGETLAPPIYAYWRAHYPDADCYQLYGPTEITGACTYFKIEGDYGPSDSIPIGRPFPNTGIKLLDEENQPIEAAGVTGELCVFGTCLAAGYYNDPEKTAAAFENDPTIPAYPARLYRTGDMASYDENGDLVYHSRSDHQIKHSGRRIELGEIESAFRGVDGVIEGCCVHQRADDELVYIYIGEIAENKMAAQVRSKLPKYMIPTRYVRRETLPSLPSGKLDRKSLDAEVNMPVDDVDRA